MSLPTERRALRLFFALWPDAGARDALAAAAHALRKACGGRAPPARNLHLTLAFLGDVAAVRLPELLDIAPALAAAPFEVQLDCAGYWRHNRLVWAGTQVCPPALQALAGDLAAALEEGGFHVERRRFTPHVTLLRDARRAPAAAGFGPVSWPARHFVLACSRPASSGIRYDIVGKWPLGRACAGL